MFALQTLVNAARRREEPGIFVAFEETARQIVADAAGFNWGLPALARNKVFFLEARLSPEVQSGALQACRESVARRRLIEYCVKSV